MDESIRLRVGLDSQDAEAGATRLNKALQNTGETTHRSFIHAQSGAKGFKAALHEIIATSPVMGNALRLAISPVAGIFMAGAAAVGYVTEKLKEAAETASRIGHEMSKPFGDTKANASEAQKAIREVQREFEKWERTQKTTKAESIAAGLKTGLGNLDEKAKVALAAGADPATTERTRQQIKYKMELNALQATAEEKERVRLAILEKEAQVEKATGAAKTASLQADDARHTEDIIQQANEEKTKKAWGNLAKGPGWGHILMSDSFEHANESWDEKQNNIILEATKSNNASKARQLKAKEAAEKREEFRKDLTDRLHELQTQKGKLKEQFENLDEASGGTLRTLRGMPFSHVQNMNEPTVRAALGVSAIQGGIDKWNQRMASNMRDWRKRQGLSHDPEQSFAGFSNAPASLATVDQKLQKLLDLWEKRGLAVFGKEQ